MPRLTRREWIQLAILLLVGWAAGFLLQRSAPLGQDVSANRTAQALLGDRSLPSREVDDATLTLVVFADYQCPACKVAYPAMEAAVAEDGHVRTVYLDLPIFGPLSERAARVAIASDRQGIYPEVHKRLMNERRRLDDAVLREAVTRSGGRWDQLLEDLQTHGAAIDRRIDLNRWKAQNLGIGGTPAFLIGPILVVGALDQKEFARSFRRAREE